MNTKPIDESRSGGTAFAAQIERDKDNRTKARSLKPLRYLWPFVARYPLWLIGFIIFLTLSTITTLSLPGVGKVIVDCGFGGGQVDAEICNRFAIDTGSNLGPYFKFAMIFAVLFSVFGSLRFYFITTLGQRVISDIRQAVYSKLLTLSPSYYEKVRTGEILSRLTTDTTLVETVITGSISFALRSVAMILGSIIMMFIVSWKLALMVLAIGPIIILPAIIIGKRIRTLSRQGQDELAGASARAGEALGSIQTVQAFTRERAEDRAFFEAIEANFASQKARIKSQTFLTALIFMISLCSITGVLWFGANSVASGWLSGGDIVAFTFYAFFTVSSAGALTETWTNLLRAAGASDRLVEILQSESEIQNHISAKPTEPVAGNISGEVEFQNVSFSYPTRLTDKALQSVSFSVSPGETIALVGPSGAGKSTIFQLLLRFYDPTSGQVLINGSQIDLQDLESVRRSFAIVQQNTPLFSGSAWDNIRYGRDGASDTDVIAAAKAAFAHEFITALPKGYNTDLGERATTLSGGQRQRIAIARAILRDAPILLLDEATSALDAESEQAVQKAFDTLSHNRTTLVIAHRLATVRKADRIIVIDEGRIVETGTHKDLVARNGLYARLAKLQFNQA